MRRIASQRIIGIDFSGGVNAGQKIWIANGRIVHDELLIESCIRGEALPDSSRKRAECLAALCSYIRSIGDALIGLDFPLGLPRELMNGQTWSQFIRTFADRFTTPQHFRQACVQAAPGRELKRRTDVEAKTPFSPYNLRLYRQTYFGLRDVIAPLVRERAVSARPMQRRRSGVPQLIEICPASTLKQLKWYHSYKGRSIEHRAARLTIVRSLQREGVQLAGQLKPIVLADPEGDALDSILAAWAAYRSRGQIDRVPNDPLYRHEGYVFV
jgi:Protein of unknown function (DUF429)